MLARSVAAAAGAGSLAGSTRWSLRVWKASALAVTTLAPVRAGSEPMTPATMACWSGWQITTFGRESPNSRPSSRSRFIGLIGTGIAPRFHAASSPITNAGVFCRTTATRSPRATPAFASHAASRSLVRSSSA